MLTGSELLAKVKELGQAPRDHIAIACGYTRKDGKAALAPFSEALMAAHGIVLPPVATKPKKGKPLAWNVAVAKSGTIPVSAGYSALLGLQPGDRVLIAHDPAAGTLSLCKAPVEPAACSTPADTLEAPPQPAAAPVRELAPF